MTLSEVEDRKLTLTSKGWNTFDMLCNEIAGENKHFSKKEVEESALKVMRNNKDKAQYFIFTNNYK